ncbi:hypothetical protein [Peribacillus frigoritolerans]|uniref:hypothetical protein n=1 Tax=Peribacillus frigoritolerans TaxID=450367 RepID=UPI0031DB40C1
MVRGEQSDTPFTEKLMEPPDCRRMERSASFPTIFPKKEVQLIGTEGTRLLRESVAKGDPTGAKRRGRTARGKRVPGVEILTHPLLQKSAPFPPAACQVLITEGKRPVVPSLIEMEFPPKN